MCFAFFLFVNTSLVVHARLVKAHQKQQPRGETSVVCKAEWQRYSKAALLESEQGRE